MKRFHFSCVRADSRSAAFTLIEMLVAVSIGAMIVVALAMSTRVFSENVEHARKTENVALAETVTNISEAVRHALYIEQPSPTQLDVTDALGNTTSFHKVGDEVRVVRPSGAVGSLVQNVESVQFTPMTTTRLREGPIVDDYGPVVEQPVPPDAAPAEAIVLGPGESIGMGFTLPTDAPDNFNSVDGVEEEWVTSSMDSILLAAAFLDEGVGGTGSLTFEIYEARAPTDARPLGAPLGSTSVPSETLPSTPYTTSNANSGGSNETEEPESGGKKGEKKVTICHNAAKGPDKAHTISVGISALDAHLAHGDCEGPCLPGDTPCPPPELIVTAPSTPVQFDLSNFSSMLEAGKAYTLVVTVGGDNTVAFRGFPLPAAAQSGVAVSESVLTGSGTGGSGDDGDDGGSGGGEDDDGGSGEPGAPGTSGADMTPVPLTVPFSVAGMRSFTSTEEIDVISGVKVEVRQKDGTILGGSASVASQVAVENPWLGVIPGEVPTLKSTNP